MYYACEIRHFWECQVSESSLLHVLHIYLQVGSPPWQWGIPRNTSLQTLLCHCTTTTHFLQSTTVNTVLLQAAFPLLTFQMHPKEKLILENMSTNHMLWEVLLLRTSNEYYQLNDHQKCVQIKLHQLAGSLDATNNSLQQSGNHSFLSLFSSCTPELRV